ncbi:kinase-like domain-containing protein [Zopfochytrium polystomum]|nr:kinase-like domain-containing protein [Zopfochytrium polystomum]
MFLSPATITTDAASMRGDSGYSTALSTPPASPKMPHLPADAHSTPKTHHHVDHHQVHHAPIAPDSQRLLDVADAASDAAFSDHNTIKARKAVRYALRTSPRLDPFRVDRILGYGSNGAVVAGHVAATGQPVAIKLIYKSAASAASASRTHDDALPREIELVQLLAAEPFSHPNLLHAHDAWQDDRHFYLVTELFGSDWLSVLFDPAQPPAQEDLLTFYNPRRGTTHTLRVSPGSADIWAWSIAQKHHIGQSFARRHPGAPAAAAPLADPRHVRQIFQKTVSAVHYLHTVANVAHGDIKEENVLVQSFAVPCADPAHAHMPAHSHHHLDVRVCDFGHAVRGGEDGSRPQLASYGTAHVTPPELQRRDKPADGFAADVFALGVLLFTLLHGPGKVPALLEAAAAKRGKVAFPKTGKLPIAGDVDPRVPRECVEIIEGMTMVRAEDRWSLEDVLAHPWMRG